MIVPDKDYNAVQRGTMHMLIDIYKEDPKKHAGEKWDCDDIARDFWNYAKRTVSEGEAENGIIGRVIFPDHAEIIYAEELYATDGNNHVYYIDQRDWSIRKPDKKPKWIEL